MRLLTGVTLAIAAFIVISAAIRLVAPLLAACFVLWVLWLLLVKKDKKDPPGN